MRANQLLCSITVLMAALAWAQQSPRHSTAVGGPMEATVGWAVASHPLVHAAMATRVGSEASYDAARAQYFPSPSVSVERGGSETSSRTTSTTLRLQQTLWAGGRLDASVDAAQRMKQLAGNDVAEAKLLVAMRTLEIWQALLTSFGRSAVARRDLDRLQLLAQMIDRRVQQEVSAQVDSVLVRARVQQAQSDLATYTAQHSNAQQRLLQWVGEPAATGYLADDQLTMLLKAAPEDASATSLNSLLDTIDRQPQVRRKDLEIAIAGAEVRQKMGDAWPNVYLRLDRQFSNSEFNGYVFQTVDTKLYIGMQYSPGPGFGVLSSARASQSRINALQQDRESTRRELHERFVTDWQDYATTAARLRSAKAAVVAATEILQAYTRLFVVGKRGWSDVLNAARELTANELALSDMQSQQVVGALRLQIHQNIFDWQRVDETNVP